MPARPEAAPAAPALAASAAGGAKATGAPDKLPLLQPVVKMIQGEPQAADARSFYDKLVERLTREQPLAADALAHLGTRRVDAVLAALQEGGVDAARVAAGAPEKVQAGPGKAVTLKLALGAR